MKQGFKYLLTIIITVFATLVIEVIGSCIYTYNPNVSYDELADEIIFRMKNQSKRKSRYDITYSTTINKDLPLLENIYHVEKILEYDEFTSIGQILDYEIDESSLHQLYMSDRKIENIWDEEDWFNTRIRDYFGIPQLDSYKESSIPVLYSKLSENGSCYFVCKELYKKGNHNKCYYLVQAFIQKEDNFSYAAFFGRGTLYGKEDSAETKQKYENWFIQYLENKVSR